MDSVRKIVNCTPEQYLTLLKEGKVEVNGEVKTKEDGTLYNPGELQLLEWYNQIMEAQYKEYDVAHTPIIAKPLEKEIADLILAYPEYRSSSCIGYRTFLNKGDIVGVASKYNNGEAFINGERVTANYSCKTDGEIVNVVVFESGYYMPGVAYPPILGATPSYYPSEIYIKNIGLIPEVATNYYLYASKITTYNFTLAYIPRGCRTLIANGTNTYTQVIPVTVLEVYSNCEQLTKNIAIKTYTKKVSLPECKEIVGADILRDLSVTNWEFGKLNKIQCTGTTTMFYCSHTVYIPDTVKYISGKICQANTNVKLECNKATSISDNWCVSAPTNFSMAKNWDCSINIAVAAKNWTKDRFIELFEDLVPVDITGVGAAYARELTIPATIFDTLTDEEFELVEGKGWVLGGA